MSRLTGAFAASLLALSLFGSPAVARPDKGFSKARVVVAVIDSAVNPYHEYFHAGGPLYGSSVPSSVTPQVLKEFGIGPEHIIEVTRTGDFRTDFAKDKAQFDAIEAGQPYWFKGTNVIGISYEGSRSRLRPESTESAHGIGTTGAVLAANPEAIVVNVEGPNDKSEEWAFTHPAVDIVSTSYGPITSVPLPSHLTHSYTGVVKNGKMHFGAAANDPSLATFDSTAGPWWTVGIAGFDEGESEGRQLSSGSFTDFVGDFTQELPYCRSCEEGLDFVSGTSFATPRAAGTFSKILLTAREAAGHRGGVVTEGVKDPLMVSGKMKLTNWQLRRALEEGAYYPTTGDYTPTPLGESPWSATSIPVLDVAPWLATGWGAITPDAERNVVTETLAQLGIGGKPSRSKGAEACASMTAQIEARHAYWDNLAVQSESFRVDEDPYIYC